MKVPEKKIHFQIIQNIYFYVLFVILFATDIAKSSDCRLGVQAKFKFAETRHDNRTSFEIVSTE